MARIVRRVALDFDWPLKRVWKGFLTPEKFEEDSCPDCKNGYSSFAEELFDLWYGRKDFDPSSTGSTPFAENNPVIRKCAEHNISRSTHFIGDEAVIASEARRLADTFNSQWAYHLSQEDVIALAEGSALREFTHIWIEGSGWQEKVPFIIPDASEVNLWAVGSDGLDSVSAHVAIKARCQREGVDLFCSTCSGRGSVEKYPGQRAEARAWEETGPPAGDGWQLWETVSEGSPVSPVFFTSDELAEWMSDPARGNQWIPMEVASKFIETGWAPLGVIVEGRGYMSGIEFVGWQGSTTDAGGN